MGDISEIDVETAAARIEAGAAVVDVREADEYVAGHVPGAVFVPLSELTERTGDIPTDRELLIICKSGGRSLRACEYLAGLGHDVINIAGGTMAWVDSGRAVAEGMDRG